MPKSARVSAYPGFVPYCDPTLSEHAPRGGGWAHEIKADGYRAQVHVVEGKVIVYSRRGHDWTDQFGASRPSTTRRMPTAKRLPSESPLPAPTGTPRTPRLLSALAGSSSIVCATAAEPPRSVLTRRVPVPDSRLQRRSHGSSSSGASGRMRSTCSARLCRKIAIVAPDVARELNSTKAQFLSH